MRETHSPKHLPGSNYIGPGTDVYTRILDDVKPTSYNDERALIHDLQYSAKGANVVDDWEMIKNSDYTPEGFLVKAGLILRSYLDNTPLGKITGIASSEANSTVEEANIALEIAKEKGLLPSIPINYVIK